jgi:hypothetical protein
MPWFPILLLAHITLAISLLLPSLLLPFVLRRAGEDGDAATPAAAIRLLLGLQGTGSVAIAIGLAATGIGLVLLLGPSLLTRPWLAVALAIYGMNLAVAAFVSRPNLRRLVGKQGRGAPEAWARGARRQRLIAYAMAGATGVIGFLMSTKPDL